nr:hypothetical protein [Puia sp.]
SHRIYDNELYHNAIYLFLHFQYNGWFSFGVLAIFLYVLNKKQVKIDERKVTRAFWLLFVACVPAYMLSLLWMNPPAWVFWLGGVAGLIQLIALAVLAGILRTILKIPDFFQKQYTRTLWILSGISFGLKLVLQAFSAVPFLGQFAFGTRPIIIGYLHLVMLGFISFFLIGFFLEEKLFKPAIGISRPALFIFLVGVIANEVFLLIQGTSFLSGNGWASGGLFLLLAALLMFAGLSLLLYFQVRRQAGSAIPAG